MNKQNYMIQLDTLRTLAVAGVALQHWVPERFQLGLPWGVGVILFFVISGFLITGILLDCRWPALVENPQKALSLRQFYIRRFLRIFPLYYTVLLILFIFNAIPVRETIFWHLCYGTNFYFLNRGWQGSIGHFWSLSVEEQFYVVWPFLILFVPRKRLLPLVAGVVLLSPAYRILVSLFWPSIKLPGILVFANFDSLGLGALLALIRHSKVAFHPAKWLIRHTNAILWFSLSAYVCIYVVQHTSLNSIWIGAFEYTFLSAFFACAVQAVSGGICGIGGKILEFRPFLYLGKISYGLYVFHGLIMPALKTVILPIVPGLSRVWDFLPCRITLAALSTVAISAFSWHLFERPINNLRQKFPYVRDEKGMLSPG
jgi:peptidoglycan/LPS O-acetylase OafA/YrhL